MMRRVLRRTDRSLCDRMLKLRSLKRLNAVVLGRLYDFGYAFSGHKHVYADPGITGVGGCTTVLILLLESYDSRERTDCLAPQFSRKDLRDRAGDYLCCLMETTQRKKSWQLAKTRGVATNHGF